MTNREVDNPEQRGAEAFGIKQSEVTAQVKARMNDLVDALEEGENVHLTAEGEFDVDSEIEGER
jgi:nucleoid DNA-binding protein